MLSCVLCETATATATRAAVIAPRIDSAAFAGALSAGGGIGASAREALLPLLDFAALLPLLDVVALLSVLCIAIYDA